MPQAIHAREGNSLGTLCRHNQKSLSHERLFFTVHIISSHFLNRFAVLVWRDALGFDKGAEEGALADKAAFKADVNDLCVALPELYFGALNAEEVEQSAEVVFVQGGKLARDVAGRVA